jgi:hypothetical protein
MYLYVIKSVLLPYGGKEGEYVVKYKGAGKRIVTPEYFFSLLDKNGINNILASRLIENRFQINWGKLETEKIFRNIKCQDAYS